MAKRKRGYSKRGVKRRKYKRYGGKKFPRKYRRAIRKFTKKSIVIRNKNFYPPVCRIKLRALFKTNSMANTSPIYVTNFQFKANDLLDFNISGGAGNDITAPVAAEMMMFYKQYRIYRARIKANYWPLSNGAGQKDFCFAIIPRTSSAPLGFSDFQYGSQTLSQIEVFPRVRYRYLRNPDLNTHAHSYKLKHKIKVSDMFPNMAISNKNQEFCATYATNVATKVITESTPVANLVFWNVLIADVTEVGTANITSGTMVVRLDWDVLLFNKVDEVSGTKFQ